MKFKIHFTHEDGTEDDFNIEGDTYEYIREKATAELERRNGSDPWSEELENAA